MKKFNGSAHHRKYKAKCGYRDVPEPLRKGLLDAALDYWLTKNGFTKLNGPGVWPEQRAT